MDIARLNEYDEALAVTNCRVAVTARLGEFSDDDVNRLQQAILFVK